MNRIDGATTRAWPPLRISHARVNEDEVRPAEGVRAAPRDDREQNLAALLEQRLTATLTKIRDDVSPARPGYSSPRGPQPSEQESGLRLDILA